MKKFVISLLSLTLVVSSLLLAGCSGSSKSVDDQFKEAWQNGLSARWKLTTADEQNKDKVYERSDYEGYIDAELNSISKFKEETFEDDNLGSLAKQYIEVLEKGKESLSAFDTDKWYTDWDNISKDRYSLLVQLDEVIQPEFSSDSDKANYESLLSDGKVVIAVKDLMEKTKFEKVSSDYGWSDYEAKMTNDTDVNFSYFSYNINLVDKDGVVVETQYASTDNWEPGSTHKFTFSTDAEFDKIEIPKCDYNY